MSSNNLQTGNDTAVMYNLTLQVYDADENGNPIGQPVYEHISHNQATDSLLTGVARFIAGDVGIAGQYKEVLRDYIPQFISLGTMGLSSQEADPETGLPTGIGDLGSGIDPADEALRFYDYMNHRPGYGADNHLHTDGSSSHYTENNSRRYPGLGMDFGRRETPYILDAEGNIKFGVDTNYSNIFNTVGATYKDIALAATAAGDIKVGSISIVIAVGGQETDLKDRLKATQDPDTTFLGELYTTNGTVLGEVDYTAHEISFTNSYTISNTGNDAIRINYTISTGVMSTVDCELISDTFPRQLIATRDIVPDTEAESPNSVDVIFEAFFSTGALASFREPDKDYIFITESGLWSRKDWNTDRPNGLLAGYRIIPPKAENRYMHAYDSENFPDMVYYDSNNVAHEITEAGETIGGQVKYSAAANRLILKENVIRVNANQVVAVTWKIQIGCFDAVPQNIGNESESALTVANVTSAWGGGSHFNFDVNADTSVTVSAIGVMDNRTYTVRAFAADGSRTDLSLTIDSGTSNPVTAPIGTTKIIIFYKNGSYNYLLWVYNVPQFNIADGSITEAKLADGVKLKLNNPELSQMVYDVRFELLPGRTYGNSGDPDKNYPHIRAKIAMDFSDYVGYSVWLFLRAPDFSATSTRFILPDVGDVIEVGMLLPSDRDSYRLNLGIFDTITTSGVTSFYLDMPTNVIATTRAEYDKIPSEYFADTAPSIMYAVKEA